jgi:hypothetical protein
VLGLLLGLLIILAIVGLWVVRGRRHERDSAARADRDAASRGLAPTPDDDPMKP